MKTRSNMAKVDGRFRDNLSQYKTGCYAQKFTMYVVIRGCKVDYDISSKEEMKIQGNITTTKNTVKTIKAAVRSPVKYKKKHIFTATNKSTYAYNSCLMLK